MRNLLDFKDSEILAIDIETTGLDWQDDKITKIAYWAGESLNGVFNFDDGFEFDKFEELIRDRKKIAVFHNANFDLKFLEKNGVRVEIPVIDTLLMAYLVNENEVSFTLKDLAVKYLGNNAIENARKIWKWLEDKKLSKSQLSSAPDNLLSNYALEDVKNTYELAKIFRNRIVATSSKMLKMFGEDCKTPITYFNEEMQPVEKLLRTMETRGVAINIPAMYGKLQTARQRESEIIKTLNELCFNEIKSILDNKYTLSLQGYKSERGRKGARYPEFNWNSNQQIGELLFEACGAKLIFPKLKTATNEWKCDTPALRDISESNLSTDLQKKICSYLLELSKIQKTISTRIGNADRYGKSGKGLISKLKNGRVHSSFKQSGGENEDEAAGTVTGRLSSAGPNLQNLDSESKFLYIPDSDKNCFLHLDYSQIELRIAAHFSKDKQMIHDFCSGEDLHTKLAQKLFNISEVEKWQRQVGKQSNFLMIFNGSAFRLQDQLREKCGLVKTIEECQFYRKGFFELYSRYGEYLEEQKKFMMENCIVLSPSGRVRRLPDLKFQKGINYKNRSYAGDFTSELNLILSNLKPKDKWVVERGGERRLKTIFDIAKGKVRHALNQGFNFPIQSFAASIIKRAALKLSEEGLNIVNQVHDSLCIEVPKKGSKSAFEHVKNVMENIVKLDVPLLVEGKILNSFDEGDLCHNL